MKKRCPKCNLDKPRTEFNANGSTKDGLQSRCRSCHQASGRQGEWQKKGIAFTDAQYDAMHAAQRGLCALCARPERHKGKRAVKRLALDHDDSTKTVRELLCSDCNTGIGKLGHDPALLKKAAA